MQMPSDLSQADANGLAGHTLLATLWQLGCRHAVFSPGSRHTPLLLAAASIFPKSNLHAILDERSAGFVALGVARLTSQAPLLLCTSGSAAGHWLPALMEAFHSGLPMLCISADRPVMLQACAAPQTTDQVHLFRQHVCWSQQAAEPSQDVPLAYWRQLGRRAHSEAHSGQGGPVHLNIPFAEPLWSPPAAPQQALVAARPVGQLHDSQLRDNQPVQQLPRHQLPAVHASERQQAASWLAAWQGQLGLIYAGADPAHHGHRDYAKVVVGLAKQLGWPIVAEPCSPLATYDGGEWPILPPVAPLLPSLLQTSVQHVLWLGEVPVDRAGLAAIGASPERQVWHIHARAYAMDPMLAGVATWSCQVPQACQALLGVEQQSGQETRLGPAAAQVRALAQRWQQAYQHCFSQMSAEQQAWWEMPVIEQLLAAMPNGCRGLVANSLSVRDVAFARCLPGKDCALYAHRGLNGIDGHLAAACGMLLAQPQAPILLILGDVAFAHDVGSLQLLGQLPPGKLVVVILVNGGGAIFDTLPIAQHPRHQELFRTPPTLAPAKVAQAFGWHGFYCRNQHELLALLPTLWRAPATGVLVEIDLGNQTHALRQRFKQTLADHWSQLAPVWPSS